GEPPAPAPHPLVAADTVRVVTPTGGVFYHTLLATAALNASPVTLTQPIEHAHSAGSPLAGRDQLILVQAIDLGDWGNRLRISVRLLHQVDPANPTRNELVIDTEVFPYLSMDMRHSRYFQNIVGHINGPLRLSDRRPDGESWYVRVEDQAANDAERQSLRLGPETLIDVLPNRRTRAARHPLDGGRDAINMMTDDFYVGLDNVNPEARTGLYSFLNIDEISI